MTDQQYKTLDISDRNPTMPSSSLLRPNTLMLEWSSRQVASAQDGQCAGSRRVVGRWGMGGSTAFHVTSSGAPVQEVAATGSYPDRVNFRSGGSIFVPRLTPGCFLKARIFYVPSGNTQIEGPAGTWEPGGPFGQVQLTHTWTRVGGTDGPHSQSVTLPVSTLDDAEVPSDEAGYFIVENFVDLTLRPEDIGTDATMVNFTEDVAVEVEVELRGAPRISEIVVYEEPVRAVYLHSDAGPHAINGQDGYEVPQSQVPVEDADDGATYDEHRFGVHRLMQTAKRQQDVTGPALFNLLAWNESTQDFTLDVEPISISAASFVDVLDTGETTYDRARPGFIIAAAHAQVHRLSDAGQILGGTAVVVPGRVLLEARLTGAATLGTVRVQSGEFEWIDIPVTSGSYSEIDVSGFFESQVTPDHSWAVVQVFAEVDADTIEIRACGGGFYV